MRRAIEAEDFHIILGYPGTGKTYLIAHLCNILALCKYKVLIVTYTHSALDNLILALIKLFPKEINQCVRFCSDRTKVTKDAQKILFDSSSFNDIFQLEDYLKTKFLFFTTCLSS